MNREIRAVAGTKFARQIASANSPRHITFSNTPEVEKWNKEIEDRKLIKRMVKASRKQSKGNRK